MDAAQVGRSILDGSSAGDVGDRRSTFFEQRRLHPFLRTAERRLGSPDDPQTIRSISCLSNGLLCMVWGVSAAALVASGTMQWAGRK